MGSDLEKIVAALAVLCGLVYLAALCGFVYLADPVDPVDPAVPVGSVLRVPCPSLYYSS